MPKVNVPFNFAARDYQYDLFMYIVNGGKRAVAVWHRRAGKELTCFNLMVTMSLQRKGIYYYFFPTYKQGKKILWEGITRDGNRILDTYAPEEYGIHRDNAELKLTMPNGSIIRIVGTDDFNNIRGTNPVGTVWSEYSYQNPAAWATVRPILDENEGWAVFNYTPNGNNQGRTIFDLAEKRPDWFCQKLTVNDTKIYRPDQLTTIREELVGEYGVTEGTAIYQREYMCSFDAPVIGSYYGELIEQAEAEGRITVVPYVKEKQVSTYWDLGVNDRTSIWFEQTVGKEIRLIDFYENDSQGLDFYAKILQDKPYIYSKHFAPHDIKVREMTTGISRIEAAKRMGIKFTMAPKLGRGDGIDAVRRILNRCWFDKVKCEQGLNALRSYCKKYDETRATFLSEPDHNWASNAADAFRYLAISYKEKTEREGLPSSAAPSDYATLGINVPNQTRRYAISSQMAEDTPYQISENFDEQAKY